MPHASHGQGNQTHLYWPSIATSDLYNKKSQNAPCSENHFALITLIETVLFTNQSTWDDSQQLLQVLFTTEEKENPDRGQEIGDTVVPTSILVQIKEGVPSTCPDWDYNTVEGEGRLLVYCQTLLGVLKAVAHKPPNMTKVYNIRQGLKKSPADFLERAMAFRQYTPMDLKS